jgi:hypothetical protein
VEKDAVILEVLDNAAVCVRSGVRYRLCEEEVAICSEIKSNTVWQNVKFLNVNPVGS